MKYNALQAVFQKTQSHGLQYQVAYTYAKCMSDSTGYYGTWSGQRASSTASPYWQNTYDRKAEWAPCYYDETHNLTAYAVYELPFGKGKHFGSNMNKAAEAVVGGWTVSPIVTIHTGFPLALTPAPPIQRARVPADCVPIATEPIRCSVGVRLLQEPAVDFCGLTPATIPTLQPLSGPVLRNSADYAGPDTTTGI